MNPLPKRLKKEPLIEAIWQAQFEGEQGIGDVLPGILFAGLKKSHTALQLRRLPYADIPAPIAQMNLSLRFVPKVLMEEPGGLSTWQVGDRIVTLNCRKPYVGWARFKEAIVDLTRIIENSGLLPTPPRHSLRYIDLLQGELASDLSPLKLELVLDDHKIRHRVQMRLEIPETDCLHIVQIAAPIDANLPEGMVTGTIIDLESFPTDAPESWDGLRAQLDRLHDRSKELFFRQILTIETIQKLEPEY